MTKAAKKSPQAKTPASPAKPAPSATTPLVTAQPQSKQQAADQAHMFLHTDDAWSRTYFNDQDLHSLERKLFG